MAIEISPKTKLELPLWSIISTVICLVLILGLLASYFYFGFKIKKISQEIEAKEAEFIPLEKAIKEKQGKLLPLEQKITDFAGLIEAHRNNLNIFRFLEENCLPNVWFSDFDFSSEENRVTVSGSTDSFNTLENQISVLSEEDRVQTFNLSDVKIEKEEGGVVFNLTITFKSSVFK